MEKKRGRPIKEVRCPNCKKISPVAETIKTSYKGNRVKRCPACLRIIPKRKK